MTQLAEIKKVFSTDELRLLVEVGFVSISKGEPGAAAEVFEAVRLLRPKQDAGYIGGALAALMAEDPNAAVQLFGGAPDTPAARTFRGLALLRSGDVRQGRGCLRSVVDNAPSSAFAQLSEELLSEDARSGGVVGSSFESYRDYPVELGGGL
ncbi:hypothetical protein [Labrenzia sp. THAF82]|uniref:tetratricopeptide repeat protein n=1 Tax=Labrenzia sp. THAF82 TaxID=2587861 RepID=UPI0012680A3F|nr:hypothetical protein [Labrenzia sp. THAF82]